jgi:hypothetical protein
MKPRSLASSHTGETYVTVQDRQLNPNASRDVRLEDQLMTIWVMYDHVAPNAFLRGPHHQNPCIFEASAERLKPTHREYRSRWLLAIKQVETQSGIAHRKLEKLAWLLSADVQPEQALIELRVTGRGPRFEAPRSEARSRTRLSSHPPPRLRS